MKKSWMKSTAAAVLALSMGLAYSPANAGVAAAMNKATTILTDVSSGLTAMGVIVATIAIMFVAYRFMFRNAQWADLAPIFWGGLLLGGAASLAGVVLA